MLFIVAAIVVMVSVLGGYMANGGHLAVLWQPFEFVIIGGAAAGAFLIANPQGYSNWELSTDRANSSRRALVEAGVPTSKFERVVGKAERDPLIAQNAFDPRNRRTSILILREAGEPPPEGQFPGAPSGATRTGEGPAPAPTRSTTTTPSAVPVTVTPLPTQPRR